MAGLSISRAWDETRAILGRDGKLFATVAAALFVLPQIVVGLVTGDSGNAGAPTMSGTTLLILIAALIGVIGQLAVAWLAIASGTSVGEAMRVALRRAPSFIGAMMILIAGIALFFVLVAAILIATGVIDASVERPAPADVLLVLGIVFVPILLFTIRLAPSVAVAAAEGRGPIAILRRSWGLTGGHFWRLLGFVILFIIAALIVAIAVGATVGALSRIVFGDIEPFSFGALLVGIVTGLLQAALIVFYVVMLARIYTQLAGTTEASVPSSGT